MDTPVLLGRLVQGVHFHAGRIGERIHRIVRISTGVGDVYGVFALFGLPLVFAFVAPRCDGGHYKGQEGISVFSRHDQCLVFCFV